MPNLHHVVSLVALASVAMTSAGCGAGKPSAMGTAGMGGSAGAPADGAVAGHDAVADAFVVADVVVSLDSASNDASPPDAGVEASRDGQVAEIAAPPACPPPVAPTASSTTPGATRAPNPTLRNITVEWDITGDANNNGVVTVRYRTTDGVFREGMPLRRIPAGSNASVSRTWGNRHSGSVFDLQPDTTYEVELALRDPDGGCETRVLTVRTRPVPAPMANAPVRPVVPATFASVAASANPGDILEMGAGSYAGFTFARSGDAARPIVLRGTAGTVVSGNVDMFDQSYVHLVGLTVNGRVRFNGGRGVAIMRNTINTTGDGVVSFLRSEDSYIADNTITGATVWQDASLGVNGNNVGEGIVVAGPGHVIEHNRVRGFRDSISTLEDTEAVDQWSIDIVENDLEFGADDGIEADFCFHNCRVVRNRITNTFIAISSQPSLGGPIYIVRNAIHNTILTPFKLLRGSVGDVVVHNTVVKNGDAIGIFTTDPISRAYFRNNLAIGGAGGTYNAFSNGTGNVISIEAADPSCDLDYDGVGSLVGTFTGRIGMLRFNGLAALRSTTTEKHAQQVDLTVFAATVTYPASPFPALPPADLRLRAGGAAIDVGVAIPNLNDGYSGSAPDLGAYEQGSTPPPYGPR